MFRSRAPILLAQKEARERRKITQREVSEVTGIRAPTISAWRKYDTFSRIDASVVAALCAYFNCTFHDLVEFVNPEEETQPGQQVAVGVR